MKFNLASFLVSVSSALDFMELDVLNKASGHCKRVAIIAIKFGTHFGLSENEIFDLASYALMHDSGLSGVLDGDAIKFEKIINHCITGEENVKQFPFLNSKKNILLYHHEFYDGNGFFKVCGDDIPFFSQIIHISDYAELLMNNGLKKDAVVEQIASQEGRMFSHTLVNAFLSIQRYPSFYLDLEDLFLTSTISDLVPRRYIETDYKKLQEVTGVFSKIIDSKSSFTARHSSGIAQKTELMCGYYKFDEEKTSKLILAAHLHDVGKLAVPNTILDKPGKLDKEEFEVIQKHTYYTRKILSGIDNFCDITEWASNHHEKLDGSGYPYGFDGSRLDMPSRLMACIDIYQALTEDRPYREGMSHTSAIGILNESANKGHIDGNIVEDIDKVFG